jgi:hypothetical protein
MTIDLQAVLRPAQRFAMLFNVALYASAGVALFLVAALMLAPVATGQTLSGFVGYPNAAMSREQSFILSTLVLLQIGLWAGSFLAGRRLCWHLCAGSVREAGQASERLACSLWGLLLWSLAGQAAASAVATWHLAQGERTVAVAFDGEQVSMALAALMAVFLARAFSVGAELWRDHQAIV